MSLGPRIGVINRIVELIRVGLDLDQNHVVTYNQMIPIPPDSGIFVAVSIVDSKPYAGSLKYRDASYTAPGGAVVGVLNEEQTVNIREVYSIQMMSRDNSARERKQELVFALTGTRAAQMQERHAFLISRLPISFVDASSNEGAERLNRYVATVVALHAQARCGPVEYFDSFPNALVTQP